MTQKIKIVNGKPGFTLIELLVVIAITALLASITLVNLKAARERGRDGKRFKDISQITRALQLYWYDYGHYPEETCPCGEGSWEDTEVSEENPDDFMEYLEPYMSYVPLDPINKKIEWSGFFGPRPGSYFYAYYRYPAGYGPCTPDLDDPFPPFAIIAAKNLEAYISPDLPLVNMPLPLDVGLPRAKCGDPGEDGMCDVDEYTAGDCRDWSQEFDYSVMLLE